MIPLLARLLHATITRSRIREATGPDGLIHRYLVETVDNGTDHWQRTREMDREC